MFETLLYTFYSTVGAVGAWCGGFYGGRPFGMMGGYWPFGMLFMGVFWVAVIALAVWAVWRLAGGKRSASVTTESNLDILKRRLASGEITGEEFNKIKKTLDEMR